jgi:adenylate cyclase
MSAILSHRRIGVERAPPLPAVSDQMPEKRRRLRARLPGDERYGDPLSVGGHAPADLLGARLALLAGESPSALKELGFGALQVWQSQSEAQGRGQGDRELTVLFTDLAGFSTWALEAGDELAVELLRLVGAALEPCVVAHRGRVVKRLGDGLMAVFDEPGDGVAAACAARSSVGELELDGHRPRLRAGLHVAARAGSAATTSGST